jgi:hypothetical protein
LAEVDLVHVDLEDLLLVQLALDLQRQQDLVDLAGEGLLGRQIEIARDLHRDRRCTLALARLAEVREAGAQDTDIVDAAVLVEARVFDREHGLLHDLRDLLDRREVAALFTELADEHAVGGEDAHRQLRPVVGEAADLGQVGVSHSERDRDHHQHRQARRSRQTEQPKCAADDPAAPWRKRGTGVGGRSSAGGLLGVALGRAHETPKVLSNYMKAVTRDPGLA